MCIILIGYIVTNQLYICSPFVTTSSFIEKLVTNTLNSLFHFSKLSIKHQNSVLPFRNCINIPHKVKRSNRPQFWVIWLVSKEGNVKQAKDQVQILLSIETTLISNQQTIELLKSQVSSLSSIMRSCTQFISYFFKYPTFHPHPSKREIPLPFSQNFQ